MIRALILGAILAAAGAAHADDIERGAVVKIEANEIYVNLGSAQGVTGGAPIRIKHPIAIKHPITRAIVSDWIPIGAATITQAGATLSRAVVGELVGDVRVGDVAEVLVHRDRPAPPVVVPPTNPAPPAPPVDPATAEVLAMFAAQAQQSVDARIAAWEQYISTHPQSAFGAAIRSDLDALYHLRDELARRPRAANDRAIVKLDASIAAEAAPNTTVPVVFVLADPAQVASAYLNYRVAGAPTYRSVLLAREHELYLRGAIPASVVTPAGVEYFVEASLPDGSSVDAYASPKAPSNLAVAEPTVLDQLGAVPGRSSVRLTAEYLDFATGDARDDADHTDHVFAATVDFTYRLSTIVQSLGVGYGVYSGLGGTIAGAADRAMLDRAAFHYGYADVELGGHEGGVALSGGGQVIAGVGKDGFGLGVEGRVRIGERDGTNLVFAARTIDQVGYLSGIRFGVRPADRVLLGISVDATDQPHASRGDTAVKLGTDVEVRLDKAVAVALRGSWQGRSTSHGGIGGGAGLAFYW